MPPVGLPNPAHDRPDGEGREGELDGNLQYQEEVSHLRLNRVHDDFSRTTGLRIAWVTRQNGGGYARELEGRRQEQSIRVGQRPAEPADLEAPQPEHVRLDGSGAAPLQDVDPEVVVVSVPAQEPHH